MKRRMPFAPGTIRNAAKSSPYMHNGVFRNLDQVMEFYNNGGGAGRGLIVPNQTLSSDSLKLTVVEKKKIIAFIKSLNEDIKPEAPPNHYHYHPIKPLMGARLVESIKIAYA